MQAIREIFQIFQKYGSANYIGEPISQTEHMIQSAVAAQNEGESNDVICAALLHDIGHLLTMHFDNDNTDKLLHNNLDLGVKNHEIIGQDYLLSLRFDSRVANLVGNHVKAKRYLISTNSEYLNCLSEASKQTFVLQGGVMTEQEIKDFEMDELFEDSLRVRHYDDMAKVPDTHIPSIETFTDILLSCLKDGAQ